MNTALTENVRAMVSDTTNALKDAFFVKIAIPSVPLWPPGKVKPAAKVTVAVSVATIKWVSLAFFTEEMILSSSSLASSILPPYLLSSFLMTCRKLEGLKGGLENFLNPSNRSSTCACCKLEGLKGRLRYSLILSRRWYNCGDSNARSWNLIKVKFLLEQNRKLHVYNAWEDQINGWSSNGMK